MRPLVYSSRFGDLGGGELRMLDHLRHTSFAAAETFCLLGQPGPLQDELKSLGIESSVIEWHVTGPFWHRQVAWARAHLRTRAALSTHRPRVVVCNTFFDLETTGKVAIGMNKPVVWRARGDTFPAFSSWPLPRRSALISLLNTKLRAILPTTHYEAEMMRAAGVNGSLIEVIHNGVDVEQFAASNRGPDIRRQHGLDADSFVLACVARLVPQKGFECLIDALAILRRRSIAVQALFVGDTTLLEADAANYRKSLESRVSGAGLGDNVRFLGFRRDIAAILHAADVVAVPSLKEPFGTTVIEAMAAGRPVVASDLPGPRESVVDCVTGLLVPPGDAEKLAGAIEQVYRSPAMRAAMGSAAQARARSAFSLDKNIRTLDERVRAVAFGTAASSVA